MENGSYLLGTHAEELERLQFQNQLWRPTAQDAWQRADLRVGESVLDVGCGPGFTAMDLARVVGPSGRVVGLESSGTYMDAGNAFARQAGLDQLELCQQDVLQDPWPQEGFDLIWSRWVTMFLPQLEPLLHGVEQCIQPGGRWVIHGYVHWDTFALHPHGSAVQRFGQSCQRSFRDGGGDPDVNRHLPQMLTQRGGTHDALHPPPVVGGSGGLARPMDGTLCGRVWPAVSSSNWACGARATLPKPLLRSPTATPQRAASGSAPPSWRSAPGAIDHNRSSDCAPFVVPPWAGPPLTSQTSKAGSP